MYYFLKKSLIQACMRVVVDYQHKWAGTSLVKNIKGIKPV